MGVRVEMEGSGKREIEELGEEKKGKWKEMERKWEEGKESKRGN